MPPLRNAGAFAGPYRARCTQQCDSVWAESLHHLQNTRNVRCQNTCNNHDQHDNHEVMQGLGRHTDWEHKCFPCGRMLQQEQWIEAEQREKYASMVRVHLEKANAALERQKARQLQVELARLRALYERPLPEPEQTLAPRIHDAAANRAINILAIRIANIHGLDRHVREWKVEKAMSEDRLRFFRQSIALDHPFTIDINPAVLRQQLSELILIANEHRHEYWQLRMQRLHVGERIPHGLVTHLTCHLAGEQYADLVTLSRSGTYDADLAYDASGLEGDGPSKRQTGDQTSLDVRRGSHYEKSVIGAGGTRDGVEVQEQVENSEEGRQGCQGWQEREGSRRGPFLGDASTSNSMMVNPSARALAPEDVFAVCSAADSPVFAGEFAGLTSARLPQARRLYHPCDETRGVLAGLRTALSFFPTAILKPLIRRTIPMCTPTLPCQKRLGICWRGRMPLAQMSDSHSL